MIKTRMYPSLSRAILFMCLALACWTDSSFALNFGELTDSPSEAKILAQTHNRPILVVIGDTSCKHCIYLENILFSGEMADYAINNQLVLFHSMDVWLCSRLGLDFARACGMYTALPHVYLFKVKEDVPRGELEADDTFRPEHVSLLEISSDSYARRKSGMNYQSQEVINGIVLEKETNWTFGTFIKVIESFFPNKQYPSGEPGWASIKSETGPTGYDQAIDLGRIANPGHPADSGPGWIAYGPTATFIGKESEHWYKFTGNAGKRYFCMAKDFHDHDNPIAIAIALYACNAGGEPLASPIFTANSTGPDALERGLYMDIPAEGDNNQLFYLRLSHSGGSADTPLSYSLKLHETHKAPAVGSVTNPLWRGAQKGQWTMDADKARELAAAEGAPLIYYFTGVLWCPYCVGMDHMVFSSAIFKDSIRNAYLVLLDNRQRDDRGPSLLLDNRPEIGYLASNNITPAAATMQLASNLKLQNALALPDASTAGWAHGSRIGYPTLLYCKVGAGTGLAGVTPIGRFSYQTFVDQPDAKQAKAFIEELARLADEGHREANASPQTSPLQLPAPDTAVEAMIGGLAHGNWFKFSVSKDQTAFAWVFDAQASQDAETVKMIDAEAQIELIVYDAAGQTLLRRAQDSLKKGCRLEFVPPSAKGGQYWLAIQSSGQTRAVPFTLSYELQGLNYSVALAHDELAVAATDTSIVLPLQLTTQRANEQPLRFEYRIRCPDTSPQAGYFTTPNTWQLAEWTAEEKASGHKLLSLPLAVPAGESWSGSRDVVVELRAVANGNCRIAGNGESCTAKIFSQAFFARPVADAYGLFAGLRQDLSFRIRNYDAGSHTVSVTGLPTGLAYQLQAPGAPGTDIDLHITGVPTENAFGEYQVTLGIRGNDNALLDQLALTITILDLAGTIAGRDCYAGHISPDNSGVGAPLGSLLLGKRNKGSSDLYLTLHSTSTEKALETTVTWQSYDPDKDQYSLSHRWEEEQAEIVLILDSAGIGRGTFTAPSGEKQAVFFAPVTQNPGNFSGLYNVVLRPKPARPPHARDGYALGWLRLTVNETGTAVYSGELIDGRTTFTCRAAVTEEADGKGRVVFFAPLNWDSENRCYQGRLAGQLAIAPKSERHQLGPPPNPACVADCSNALWARSATDEDPILPCGTTYQAGMTLTKQAGLKALAQDFLLEIQPTAQNERTVVPDWIALYERRDGGALLPRHNNLLTNKNISIAIDAPTGLISGSITVLHSKKEDQPLTPTPTKINGLLTPVTSDCCSGKSDLFLGYGYFIWEGTSYAFRIGAPDEVEQNPTPALISSEVSPFGQGKATITIQSPSKRMLYQHQGSDKLYLADWSDGWDDSIELALATGTTWQFVALSQPQDEDKKAPSEPLTLTLTAALRPGWNLIGVPAGKRYTVAGRNPPTFFGYVADRRCYTRTTNLPGGKAYWLFTTAEDSIVTFVQTEEQLTVNPRPYAWSLLAIPSEGLPFSFDQPTWYWNGQSYSTIPPANGIATGAWFYLESLVKRR